MLDAALSLVATDGWRDARGANQPHLVVLWSARLDGVVRGTLKGTLLRRSVPLSGIAGSAPFARTRLMPATTKAFLSAALEGTCSRCRRAAVSAARLTAVVCTSPQA